MARAPADSGRQTELESLSQIFMPVAGTGRGTVIKARGLHLDACRTAVASHDVVICGRLWHRKARSVPSALLSALLREVSLAIARARTTVPVHAIYRLPPPAQLVASAKAGLRSSLLAGFLVELWGTERPIRVIDAAALAAEVETPSSSLRPGSGVSWLAVTSSKDGHDTVFRMGLSETPGDPSRAADCLALLQETGLEVVPKLRARGHVSGVSWSTESMLTGQEPRGLTPLLFSRVVRFSASLPRTSSAPAAPGHDLDLIRARFPKEAACLEDLRERLDRDLGQTSGVLRHGDLWSRNLLAEDDRLTGVVDWDAWHPSGAPGADLVYLFLTEMWGQDTRSLGELWASRPWRQQEFIVRTVEYWTSISVEPTPVLLDAIAAAAWGAQVASSLRRTPLLAHNSRWVRTNIQNVLEHIDPNGGTTWQD